MLKPQPVGHSIDRLFISALSAGAANVHLKVGQPPVFRVNGELQRTKAEPFTPESLVELCHPILDERHLYEFEEDGGTDFAHVVSHEGLDYRFRVNLFTQCGSMALVAQAVEPTIPPLEELHLPPVLEQLCHVDQGMILVAGMTGTGKTTTIAAMLDWINQNYRKHILTIEDPVEYVFNDDKSLIKHLMVSLSKPIREKL